MRISKKVVLLRPSYAHRQLVDVKLEKAQSVALTY